MFVVLGASGNTGKVVAETLFRRKKKVRGTSLRPVPPVASKVKGSRHLKIHEGDELDEAQMATWVKQAAALPGWVPGN